MSDHRQPSTVARGSAAEAVAEQHLLDQGYEIVDRNYYCAVGEIDIVAREGDVLCFVEVRSARTADHGHPLESIGPKKIRRLIGAARKYIEALPTPWPMMRFDAVGIVMSEPPDITLVREAFET